MTPSADIQHPITTKVVGRPFKPGQSGNPQGRPKKELTIPAILAQIGNEPMPDDEKITLYEAMCRKAWEQAIAGDRWARAWIADRTEGTPKQTVHIQQHEPDRILVINDES